MANVERKKSHPITMKQKEILTDCISQREEMYTGRFTASYTKEKMIKNWMEVTNISNSIPNGPAKEWRQWKKTWIDIKKNTKSRAVKERKYAGRTGGGPPLPPNPELDLDQKILNIIPPVTIQGDENINESFVSFSEHEEAVTVSEESWNKEIEQTNSIVMIDGRRDHDYLYYDILPRSGEKNISTQSSCHTAPMNSGTSAPMCSSQTAPMHKKIRVNKTSRLQESSKTNTKFIDLNEDKFKNDKQYQDRKIHLMETEIQNKQTYRRRKATALESIADSSAQIASRMSESSL